MSIKTTKRLALGVITALVFAPFAAITPASAVITSFYVSKDSVSGGLVRCAQTLTVAASTITSGGGVCLSDDLTPAGTGIFTDEDGFLGRILTNTTPAGGTVATLTANAPAQAVVAESWYKGTVAATTVPSGVIADAINGMTVTVGAAAAFNLRGNDVATVNGAAKATIGGQIISGATNTLRVTDDGMILPFTAPVAPGVYNVVITVKDQAAYAATDPTINFTLTVVAASDLDLGLSTAFMTTPAANGADASSTTNAVARTAAKAVGTNIAQIKITLLRANGTADARAHRLDATVAGVGFVDFGVVNQDLNFTTRADSDVNGASVRYLHIDADGTAGTGTVTLTVTHVDTNVRSTLGTFTYTTYDDVAKLEVSSTLATIGLAGGDSTGQAVGVRTIAGNLLGFLDNATTRPAFIVAATDSAGRPANSVAAPTIVSSATTVVASGTCVRDEGTNAGARSSSNGVGFYNCAFTTAATSKSGDKATLTIRIVDPADADKFITTTIDVTVGGGVATETLAFDKATYAPGEAMVITRTAKDASGNPVADGTASPAVTFNRAIGGTAPVAGFYTGGVSASAASAAVSGLFAPSVTGEFAARATSGNAAGDTITATASVPAPEAPAAAPDKPTLTVQKNNGRVILSGTAVDGEGDIVIYVKTVGTSAWKERAKTLEVAAPGDFNGSIRGFKQDKVMRVKQEGTGLFSNQVIVKRNR